VIDYDTSAYGDAMTAMKKTITEAMGESTLRTVGFAGVEIFRDQAQQNSLKHYETGTLYSNIIVKRLEEESDGGRRQVYIVTVRNGTAGSPGAFYWRFVEFGHKFVPRNTKRSKTGRTVGWKAHRKAAELEYGTASAPAYPFMRPAYESKKHEAVDVMTRTLAEQIARNAR